MAARWLFWTLIAVGGLVGILFLIGLVLYLSDYGVEATVQERRCANPTSYVDVKTKAFGIQHSAEVPIDVCMQLREGNFVVYHIRSQQTTVYVREGGDCIYDTVKGAC
jgi:hypothetical protein